jgi:hypothetical protein
MNSTFLFAIDKTKHTNLSLERVRLTNDSHFSYGFGAICSESFLEGQILILPQGGRFISKMKLQKKKNEPFSDTSRQFSVAVGPDMLL